MTGFLQKFFPVVAQQQEQYNSAISGDKSKRLYCAFNDDILQLMTSVLFLAGTVKT